jgi:ATP-dependent helicase HrpA
MPTNTMASLESRIQECMLADQRRFMRRLRRLEKRGPMRNAGGTGLAGLGAEIERSRQRRRQRHRCLPNPGFPGELPISSRVADIARAIDAHPVVIVCGETGSGKTTQIPKICLQVGRGAAGLIGHTQPRRVAARSTAARIAAELDTHLGGGVGYKLRFDQRVGEDCYLKVLTDGMAQSKYRFSVGLHQAAAGTAHGSQTDHQFGHYRYRAIFRVLLRRAHHRGFRPGLSSRNSLSAAAGCR